MTVGPQCVVLLGGRGTRLGLDDLPKPMVDIAGQPLLQRIVLGLRSQGIRRFLFLVDHLEDVLRNRFGDGSAWDVEIEWVRDPGGLGTAGATAAAAHVLDDAFLVVYGDLLFDIDTKLFLKAARAAGGHGTIMIHPNSHPYDSDLVEIGESSSRTNEIAAFLRKPHPEQSRRRNMASAGIYYLSKAAVFDVPMAVSKPDWGRDVFPKAVTRGARYSGYRTIEYIKDIGTPDRLSRALCDLQRGIPARRSYRANQRVVFLDRDGVINREIDGVFRPEDLELLPGSAEAIARLNAAGLPVILATNQPSVAKGAMSERDLLRIHAHLDWQLAKHGAFLDDKYVCIHHPELGHPGERSELKINCQCRKPKGGLFLHAARDHKLNLRESVMIGDRAVDVTAVKSVGGHAIRVATNGEVNNDTQSSIDAIDLVQAVDRILDAIP